MFSLNVVFDARRAPGGDLDFPGLMVLGTACQRTAVVPHGPPHSSQTALPRSRDLLVYRDTCADARRVYMPAGVGGADLVIGAGAGVLEANIPLLASNQLLDDLGVILDMPQSTATFAKLGATVPVCGVNGRLTISVLDFCKRVATHSSRWKQLQDSVDWSDPPPLLVFMAQAVFIATPRDPAVPHAAPVWLRNWRRMVRALRLFKRSVFIQMAHRARAVNLVPRRPKLSKNFANPLATCKRPEYVWYGNAYGKFARCKRCPKR